MTILITGGAGYLGSVLSSVLLEREYRVRILDNFMFGTRSVLALAGHERVEIVRGDLCNGATIRAAVRDVDAVVHLGAIVGDPACARSPELARAVNLDASLNLFRLAQEHSVRRFVFASTCSNYGKLAENSDPATEDFQLRPLSLYAETKVAVEQKLLTSGNGSIVTTVLRFATLYGLSPRMRFDLTVNEFVLNLLVDRKLVVYGEQFWRPYVHVRDAARAIALVLESPPSLIASQVLNVGDSNENYRKLDLAEIISRRAANTNIEFVTRAEDPRDYRVCFDRIRTHLGYAITKRVPDGVEEVAHALELGLFEQPRSEFHSNTGRVAMVA
jgi:nucleoside-diphosphate-sugar epimerase